ncbi:hypothetical protein KIN20_028438 [Parelaphostrongylus tenuis]|uniref:Uncharacterized protein n=1 Tax=Parelaphostrongylus tenuis TaxID=148309 RepID=A0AAD5WF19_PARTN|nr:hypothetical protein KIN20_028438 [Parelaphostrongylus tenuis]
MEGVAKKKAKQHLLESQVLSNVRSDANNSFMGEEPFLSNEQISSTSTAAAVMDMESENNTNQYTLKKIIRPKDLCDEPLNPELEEDCNSENWSCRTTCGHKYSRKTDTPHPHNRVSPSTVKSDSSPSPSMPMSQVFPEINPPPTNAVLTTTMKMFMEFERYVDATPFIVSNRVADVNETSTMGISQDTTTAMSATKDMIQNGIWKYSTKADKQCQRLQAHFASLLQQYDRSVQNGLVSPLFSDCRKNCFHKINSLSTPSQWTTTIGVASTTEISSTNSSKRMFQNATGTTATTANPETSKLTTDFTPIYIGKFFLSSTNYIT